MDLKELELGVDPKKHWYYQSKKLPLIRFIRSIAQQTNAKITLIDVGSGSGFFMYELMKALPECIQKIWLVDIGYTDEELSATKAQMIEKTRALPQDICNGVYVMMDVLEHLPDDLDMLKNIKKSCTGTNYYFITVPAFMSLWSGHDVYLEYYRRYTRRTLNQLLDKANFQTQSSYYLYNTIFPFVWFIRKIGNKTHNPKSNMRAISPILNNVLKTYHSIEGSFSKWNKLFGVTCVAEGRIT